LALSSAHLGISAADYSPFETAFLSSIETAFDSHTALVWTKVWREIRETVVPACVEHEAAHGTMRPLRLSGSSTLRDATETEAMTHYALYAHKLVSSSGDEDDNDPKSVNRRLYTSLHNTIEDYESAAALPSRFS
jgi:hypothetical protein